MVIEWLDNTEAKTSYREYVIRKYGKELLRQKADERERKPHWYS